MRADRFLPPGMTALLRKVRSANLRHYGLGAGAFFRKNLTANPTFLMMAARAFIGPALRSLRSAILWERVATEYHARTLFARYKGFLTWHGSGDLGRQDTKGVNPSKCSPAPGSSSLLGADADTVNLRKTTR